MAQFAVWLERACCRVAERLGHGRSVRIESDAAVYWPEQCIVCCGEADDRLWTVSLSRTSPFSLVLGSEPWWRVQRFHAPMCEACWRRNRRRLWARRVVPVIVLVTMVLCGLTAAQWLSIWSPALGRVVMAIVLLVAILTAIVVNLAIGSPIEVSRDGDQLVFEFNSCDAAEAFARCNDTEIDGLAQS